MRPIRLGLVGAGAVARNYHVPSIAASSSFNLVGCADPKGGIPDVAHFHSIEAMLEASPEVDAISICTPPQLHYEAARLALWQGKHVLLEKPPCTSLSQLESLECQAGDRGCTLYQTWHSQYARAVPEAAGRLEGRKLLKVEIQWKEDARRWHAKQGWLFQPGGFGVLDCGINALSILTRLVARAIFPTAGTLFVPTNCGPPIAAELELATEDGVPISAVFDYRHTGPEVWEIAFHTDVGVLRLSSGGNVLTQGDEVPHRPEVTLAYEYGLIYQRFAELIARGASQVDARPLALVADILMTARQVSVPAWDI